MKQDMTSVVQSLIIFSHESTASSAILNAHNTLYTKLRGVFIHVAEPLSSVRPDSVTLMSLLCTIPAILALQAGMFHVAALVIILHDCLDRLDGCVAYHWAQQGKERDGAFGAFFDAQCDKVFNISMSVYLIGSRNHSLFLCLLLAMNIITQTIIAIVRVQDYLAVRNGNKLAQAAVRAVGCGKAATCQSNMTYTLAALSGLVPAGSPWVTMEVVLLASMLITLDCTLKSLEQKLLNRRVTNLVATVATTRMVDMTTKEKTEDATVVNMTTSRSSNDVPSKEEKDEVKDTMTPRSRSQNILNKV